MDATNVEPIGFTNSDELQCLVDDAVGQFFPKADWFASIPLYSAEALDAIAKRSEQDARADLAVCWDALQTQTARADKAEAINNRLLEVAKQALNHFTAGGTANHAVTELSKALRNAIALSYGGNNGQPR